MSRAEINMSTWTRDTRREPVVRIGVILDEDAAERVRAILPASPYVLEDGTRRRPLPPGANLTVSVRGEQCEGAVDDTEPFRAPSLRLIPVDPAQRTRGGGVLIRDLIAGRGFHWERRVDQTLSGVLEFRSGHSGVVLINEIPLESYLAGVITAEMSGACPPALLEAQCIVARSWLLAMTEPKHVDEPFDRCNDDCCQRYQGTDDLTEAALAAVARSRGRVLLEPGGGVLDANYSKSCGGVSETPENVWGHDKPGLSSVVDAPASDPLRQFARVSEANLDEFLNGPWLRQTQAYCSPNVVPVDQIGRYLGRVDSVDDYFRWTVRYDAEPFGQLLRTTLPGAEALAEVAALSITKRGVSGRACELVAEWRDSSGGIHASRLRSEYAIRAALHEGFLYSSAISIRPEYAGARLAAVTLRGAGWGHGAGLCQIGALGMALRGIDSESICRHYYPLAGLANVYD
jgi:SpoIID/LytB domain protein